MDEKTLTIVKAGWAMFARYGYPKTTMSDIATEAGVARQTVYNAFPNKEEVLRAVVRLAGEQSLAEVKAAWAAEDTLSAKIAVFQRLGPLSWYVAIQAAPDWGALMEGMNTSAGEIMAAQEVQWIAALEKEISGHVSKSPEELRDAAAFIYSSSKNTKYGAKNVAEVEARLAVIHKAAMALLAA